ncbi:MAG: hypothetical protein JWO56_2377 [Acidobacteria bacterium]|nr:hypothetical protein [Acidobacteriota bacterium]
MKHGDQAKAKSAKAQASPEKSSKAVGASKGIKSAAETSSKTKSGSSKAIPKKSAAAAKAGPSGEDNGGGKTKAGVKAPAARGPESEGFSNPVIASAFKRAVKKYPNAFRKLTD